MLDQLEIVKLATSGGAFVLVAWMLWHMAVKVIPSLNDRFDRMFAQFTDLMAKERGSWRESHEREMTALLGDLQESRKAFHAELQKERAACATRFDQVRQEKHELVDSFVARLDEIDHKLEKS